MEESSLCDLRAMDRTVAAFGLAPRDDRWCQKCGLKRPHGWPQLTADRCGSCIPFEEAMRGVHP